MEVDPPRPRASATFIGGSGTDGLNEPVPCEAALEAVVQTVSGADSATERTALVNPEARPLEAPIARISAAPGTGAPESTGVGAPEIANVSVTTTIAPEAPGVGAPEVTSASAPMAAATNSAPGEV